MLFCSSKEEVKERGALLSPRVWKQVVVPSSAGFGEFFQYEERGPTLCRGQVLS